MVQQLALVHYASNDDIAMVLNDVIDLVLKEIANDQESYKLATKERF